VPEQERRQVLVVDADAQIDAAITAVLSPVHWAVHHAEDNATALEMANSDPFDLVITGPRTSGKQDVILLRAMRRIRPNVRFIVLTEQSTPADVIASMRERAFSYFTLPLTPEVFSHMVRNATEDGWEEGVKVVSATPEWICLLVRCDLKSADRLVQFMKEIAGLPLVEQQDVGLAFREMLMNAIEHGGHFDPSQYVEISYVHTRGMVMCRVKDPGEGFSFEEIQHAAFANPEDDPIHHIHVRNAQGLRPGGFGVLMARNLVDELIYSEKGNEVMLVKYLPGHASSSA
jgi:anti-sigma regulatory factor (Ser/Thr protein kinase)/ActR/RegA family two-component response regulator